MDIHEPASRAWQNIYHKAERASNDGLFIIPSMYTLCVSCFFSHATNNNDFGGWCSHIKTEPFLWAFFFASSSLCIKTYKLIKMFLWKRDMHFFHIYFYFFAAAVNEGYTLWIFIVRTTFSYNNNGDGLATEIGFLN